MNQTFFLFSIALSLLLFSCNASKTVTTSQKPIKGQGVSFVKNNSLQPILDRAKAENKLIFLDFYTTWCLPCQVMDEEVFSLASTGAVMNKEFISYKVNAEKGNGPTLSTVFNVYAYPTLLFLDTEGNVLERQDGSLSNSQFLRLAENAIEQGQ
ncbi:MAG: thiol:disulfide interchange protein [Saprospiraceae bacterium]